MRVILVIVVLFIFAQCAMVSGAVGESIRTKSQRRNRIELDWHRLRYEQAQAIAPAQTQAKVAFVQFRYYASVITISSILGVVFWYVVQFAAIDLKYRRQVKVITFNRALYMIHSGPNGTLVFNPATESVVLLGSAHPANLQIAEYSAKVEMSRRMGVYNAAP